MKNCKILVVDDEAANLRLLERLFRREYNVVTAESGAEALELLSLHDVALIISDQRMPTMTGIEFLRQSAEIRPNTVRIILTGYTDVNALVEAINSGVVYKYVNKPWVNEDLQQTVKRALQHYETLKSQNELRLQNKRLQANLNAARESFTRLATEALKLKNPNLVGHISRTRDHAVAIGRHLHLEVKHLAEVSLAAFLHETAHLLVPAHLTNKIADLDEQDRAVFMRGFEQSMQILETMQDFEEIVSAIRYQHENYDGSGFPVGLVGDQIPLYSRIIAAANAFDELTFPKSSETALSDEQASEYLMSESGKKFDPEVVNAVCEMHSNEVLLEIF